MILYQAGCTTHIFYLRVFHSLTEHLNDYSHRNLAYKPKPIIHAQNFFFAVETEAGTTPPNWGLLFQATGRLFSIVLSGTEDPHPPQGNKS